MKGALEPIDSASHPALSGVLAPVDDELSMMDLQVVGRIPDDLRGVYLRNGQHPWFRFDVVVRTRKRLHRPAPHPRSSMLRSAYPRGEPLDFPDTPSWTLLS